MAIGGNNPDQSRYYNPAGPGINSVGSYQVSGTPVPDGYTAGKLRGCRLTFLM